MKNVQLKNGQEIVIRKAVQSDAAGLVSYIDRISSQSDFLTFGPGEFNVTVTQEEAFIEGISTQNNALMLVAEAEGQIIANLSFSGGPRPRVAHVGELGVSVLEAYWNQGVGTKLMEYLIEWAKESKTIRKINLRVRSDNHSAIHVYKKLGFIEEGLMTRDFFVNETFYDALSMGLKID